MYMLYIGTFKFSFLKSNEKPLNSTFYCCSNQHYDLIHDFSQFIKTNIYVHTYRVLKAKQESKLESST